MDMYGVAAICFIVPILVMSAVYYLLKDLKFEDAVKAGPGIRRKKNN